MKAFYFEDQEKTLNGITYTIKIGVFASVVDCSFGHGHGTKYEECVEVEHIEIESAFFCDEAGTEYELINEDTLSELKYEFDFDEYADQINIDEF